jgi:preprotein translocase subunit SecD
MFKKVVLPIFLLAFIIGGGLLFYFNRGWFFRPDFDKVGGTELVFEIDPRDSGTFSMDELCQALRRRFDPTETAGITVKPEEEGRVVVRVPNGNMHDESVESINTAAAVVGKLEFLIVANDHDDARALEAARDTLVKSKDELARLEKAAEPPPPPVEKGKFTFPVDLPDEPDHSYRWVELDKSYLQSLRLNSTALDEEGNAERKKLVEEAVSSGQAFYHADQLICARKITDWEHRRPSDREQGKTHEFFVLLREPEKGKEIDGEFLTRVDRALDMRERAAIDFTFSKEGGERFYDLTSRNRPTGGEEGVKRHLAIVFDGRVMSAPRLMAAIRDRGQITGNFTLAEVDQIIRILRAGALPARLKPEPVSIRKVAAK